jgi:hypothetical protein
MSKRTKNRKGKVGRGKHNAQWMRENWAREIRLAKAKRGV